PRPRYSGPARGRRLGVPADSRPVPGRRGLHDWGESRGCDPRAGSERGFAPLHGSPAERLGDSPRIAPAARGRRTGMTAKAMSGRCGSSAMYISSCFHGPISPAPVHTTTARQSWSAVSSVWGQCWTGYEVPAIQDYGRPSYDDVATTLATIVQLHRR